MLVYYDLLCYICIALCAQCVLRSRLRRANEGNLAYILYKVYFDDKHIKLTNIFINYPKKFQL